MNALAIQDRLIGDDCPVFVAAEIGINHNGDVETARALIRAAADAGADSVKFQSYETSDFVRDPSLTYAYESGGKTIEESQRVLFDRCQLSVEQLVLLRGWCSEAGVVFHATPTSPNGVLKLVDMGAPVLKNGSDFLTRLDVITAMGESGLPTVLSTGMATLSEIESAVVAFRRTGNAQLILLHCTSSYPTPLEHVHLRRMVALRSAFDCLVGFSDHTEGTTTAPGAVALGACWIEKHFTLDKTLPGPDHRFSADPGEFQQLVRSVRAMETCLGSKAIAPSESELDGREQFRVSCAAATALPKGHALSESDVVLLRPATGVAPAHQRVLLGRRTVRAMRAGEPIRMDDVE